MIENRLITIPISHYCEKARWALEWSKIPYVEEKHLQGFHYLSSFAAARSPLVPVLVTRDRTLSDSTDIVHWCDIHGGRKLRPLDPDVRREADELEDMFDEQLGVKGRLWMYTYMLHEIPTILHYSKKHGVPAYETALMPMFFPFIKGFIHRRLKFVDDSRRESKAVVDRIYDDVAKRIVGKKFLLGDTFTSADLTFAALSASVLIPENYGVALPTLDELPEEMREQVKIWRQHPAGQFALRLYQENRGLKN